ncbi:MAG TPA: preprotein translocase subunit SecA, partial [Candidatus Kryptonia bacterium]|nr:preprotein translocase subunit SecA [Candidatus Kryptonia bacterium]
MLGFVKKIIGTKNDRELKRLWPIVRRINELEDSIQGLTDEDLRAKTAEFKAQVQQVGNELRERLADLRAQLRGEPGAHGSDGDPETLARLVDEQEKALYAREREELDAILPEAFACVREASKRTIGLRHFDSQLIGGMVLHDGKIAEMKTGEGKTLVATLPIYLNALSSRGVHLITVNDYLARRDVQWMGPIYHALGLTVASIVHDTSYLFDPHYVVKDYRLLNLRPIERKEAYLADITYGTNHEFGFDYLRDNMKFSLDEYVQRELNYAIVDEVDNILIDEARTPLIISGPAEESTDKYYNIDRIIPRLKRGAVVRGDVRQEDRAEVDAQGDFTVDEKSRNVVLTEGGVAKVERMLGITNLYEPGQIDTLHHVNQALKAHAIFKRDVDYIVKDGQVIIVDEFTGRLMPGRRWSDGLHQAVEAKEGVRIERENQTLATITIQNYFRMYKKLAGMTGTADTESVEFKNIYKLDVIVVPPNRQMVRIDHPDVVYKSEREKFNAVIEDIVECHEKGQPVLVGTVSVEKSEQLGKLLKKAGVKHNVLNAVNHEAEANIIAQAGRYEAVTIATNMAGRGTDILLGGNPEFLARSELENEWVRRTASLPEGHHRYEDALQQLRERYDEAVQNAFKRHQPLWEPFEHQQAKALEDLTAAHREYLEAAFWKTRREYEESLAHALEHDAVDAKAAETCVHAVTSYGDALQELDRVTGPHFGEEGQQRFQRGLDELKSVLTDLSRNGAGDARALAGVRTPFERVRLDYERAVQRVLSRSASDPDGYAEAKAAYDAAEQAYKQAEASYLEQRKPYEEAVVAAQREYEATRKKYTKVVEDVREQIDKAPEEFRTRFDEAMEKYRGLCAEEHDKVLAAGGLYIVGTERHESRRIDNQLRGRAGRQGDPGASRFYLSLEDDLLRIFGAERIQGLMTRLGMEEGEPIEHRLITRAVANAQSKVEAHNFDIRKHLLEYDDVMNKQREVIYARRRAVLGGERVKETVQEMIEDVAGALVEQHANREIAPQEWDWPALEDACFKQFNLRPGFTTEQRESFTPDQLAQQLLEKVRGLYEQRERGLMEQHADPRYLEKLVLLQTIDTLWKDHLLSMDHLKEGISLRGYGQKNPLQEYQKEGFEMFEAMMQQIQVDAVEKLFTVQVVRQEDVQRMEQQRRPKPTRMVMSGGGAAVAAAKPETVRQEDKVGRNDPCPCGSGKKY